MQMFGEVAEGVFHGQPLFSRREYVFASGSVVDARIIGLCGREAVGDAGAYGSTKFFFSHVAVWGVLFVVFSLRRGISRPRAHH